MPKYIVHYTGPDSFEVEAPNSVEAELQAEDEVVNFLIAEEVEDE